MIPKVHMYKVNCVFISRFWNKIAQLTYFRYIPALRTVLEWQEYTTNE